MGKLKISSILFLFFMGCLLPGYAQTDISRPPFTLKLAGLSLLDRVQTAVELRSDIPLGQRWGFEAGFGYIFHSAHYPESEEYYRGIKIRPGIKYYLRQTEKKGRFLSLNYRLQRIQNQHYTQEVQNEDLIVPDHRRLSVQGLTLNYGVQHFVGRKKRVVIEPYVGLGYRWMYVGPYTNPNATGFRYDDVLNSVADFMLSWQDNFPGHYSTIDISVGLNIGWRWTGKQKS